LFTLRTYKVLQVLQLKLIIKEIPATQRVATMRRDLIKIRDGRGLWLLILVIKAAHSWSWKVTIFPRIEEALPGSRGESCCSSGRRWC